MASHEFFDQDSIDHPAPPDLIGGRYRLEHRIGDGRSAVTYRAYDVVLRRPVALKLLRPEYAADQVSSARFAREARAVAAVNHPHVVQVYDSGTHKGQAYLVMQYVAGRNLKQVLADEGPLAPDAAVRLGRRLLRGLGAIHAAGIVHRDVKPQNILVGDDGSLRVTDFGIARGPTGDTLTDDGATVGTAAYMAPEQIRGEPVSAATDLYAIGVVLFELLTGRLPFAIEHPVATMLVRLQQPAPAPSRFAYGIPPALDKAILRALAKAPAARYASAAEMERALDAAISPHTASHQPIKPGRVADWFGALLLALIALALLGGALAATLGRGSDDPTAEVPTGVAERVVAAPPAPTATARVIRAPVVSAARPSVTVSNPTVTEPPAATELPPATKAPRPRPTSTAAIVPVQDVAPTRADAVAPMALQFGAADWQGGYYRGDAAWYGRAWTAIYGAQSQYPRASLTISLPAAPSATATLSITGLDDEWAGSNSIAVSVNGVEIFSGPSSFSSWDGVGQGDRAAWAAAQFTVPEGVLHKGVNEIVVANLAPSASFGQPPYVLVSDASLEVTG